MKFFLLFCIVLFHSMAKSQTEIPLYSGEVPNSKNIADREYTEKADPDRVRIHNISRPTLTIFAAPKEKANGSAVVICPGGGYSIIAIGHEGYDVAKKFTEMGVTAFVLKYRIPRDSTMVDKTIGPLQDAQRAIQYVRENAKQWQLNKNKIGLMGFSAGGHLASTAATHFEKPLIPNKKKTSLRPNFLILVYPVISFTDTLMHQGSRDNLLGKNPPSEKIHLYSNELQVTRNTPPTYLVHAKDDSGVKYQNSVKFYEALKKNSVPSEIYLFDKGGHGFGMNNPASEVKWMDHVQRWMQANGLLSKKK